MKYIPLTKHHNKIYIFTYILWVVIYALEYPCGGSPIPTFEIWLSTIVALLFIFAWSSSLQLGIVPNSIKNIIILASSSAYELIFVGIIYLLLSLPILIVLPTYQCYNDRASNAEIIVSASIARNEITNIIQANESILGDYSNIDKPEHERMVYFSVTPEGVILMHAENPDFTVYLTPSYNNGNVIWGCRTYPRNKSPAMCR